MAELTEAIETLSADVNRKRMLFNLEELSFCVEVPLDEPAGRRYLLSLGRACEPGDTGPKYEWSPFRGGDRATAKGF